MAPLRFQQQQQKVCGRNAGKGQLLQGSEAWESDFLAHKAPWPEDSALSP